MIIKKEHYIVFSAIAALLVYGGWAILVNFEHGLKSALTAGIVQGIYAFIATFSMTKVAQNVFLRCGRGAKGIFFGFLIGAIIMAVFPIVVHMLAGTPDIIETILPGLIWGGFYLLGFLYFENKKRTTL